MSPEAIRALRERLGLSQAAFALRYRLNRRTVESWECANSRLPDVAATTLLTLIDREPDLIAEILARDRDR